MPVAIIFNPDLKTKFNSFSTQLYSVAELVRTIRRRSCEAGLEMGDVNTFLTEDDYRQINKETGCK